VTTSHLVLRYTHIAMGMVGLLSGTAAMTLRKGTRWHARAGIMFFGSMLTMAATGAFIAAFIAPNSGNVMGGLLTFYLVLTAWTTVWRPAGHAGRLEIGGAALGATTAVTGAYLAARATSAPLHRLDGYPPALFIAFGSIALLASLGDAQLIWRGGVKGAVRTTRHLWRMCFAMFMATSSFFLGAASRRFPAGIRESGLLPLPVLLVVLALCYWLIQVRLMPTLRKRSRRTALVPEQA
jgi:hypothetical protein